MPDLHTLMTVQRGSRHLLLGQVIVKNRNLTTPPGAPAERDRHIVAAVATDAWAGKENQVAEWVGGAWQFSGAPQHGWRAFDQGDSGGKPITFDGAGWVADSAVVALNDGDVTTPKIANDAVTNAKLANMAQATFKMRAAGAGTGDPIDGTVAQAQAALGLPAVSTDNRLLRHDGVAGAVQNTAITCDDNGSLDGVHGVRKQVITLNDDTAVAIPLTGIVNCFVELVTTQQPSSINISAILLVRLSAVFAPISVFVSDATNVTLTTGALAGTTGADGKLTISCNGDGNLYVENRLGSSKGWGVAVRAYI